MKKFSLITTTLIISFFLVSMLSSLTYSSNPLLVECSIEGKVLELEEDMMLVEILESEIMFVGDECPVDEGDIFEVNFAIRNLDRINIEVGDIFTAHVGRFWTTTELEESEVILNWFDIRDLDGEIITLVNPQSDVNPIDLEESETTIIDEYTTEVSNRFFDLTLERRHQSAFGKHVPYILTITPHIDSRRTQILWNIPPGLEVRTRHSDFVNLRKGETYTFKANIVPIRSGTYDFSVSALAWEHDTNYTNAISDRIQFDSNLVLQPVSAQYQWMNVLKFALIFLAFGGVCFGVYKISMKYFPKFKEWITPPPM